MNRKDRPVRRKFNLLVEGTGVRYTIEPPKGWLGDSSFISLFAASLLAIAVLAAVIFINKDSLFRWELDFSSVGIGKEEIPADIPPPVEDENRRKRVVLDESGGIVDSQGLSLPESVDGLKRGYYVRFAVCLEKACADSVSERLKSRGVKCEVVRSERAMPLYRLKVGPLEGTESREKTLEALKNLGVANMPFIEQKYYLTEPVWVKSHAQEAIEELKSLDVNVEMLEERGEREVFLVVSVPFASRRLAGQKLEDWQRISVTGVIEERL